MVHILDLVLESTIINVFFLAMLAEYVRMREQLCHIDHPDPTTKMPFTRSLVSVLPRVIRLTLCLHLFQVLADALRVNTTITTLILYGNPIGDEGVKAWRSLEDHRDHPDPMDPFQWFQNL